MKNLLTEPSATVGERFFEHLFAAAHFSASLLLAGIVCLVHALLPFLFVKTGCQFVSQLYQRMTAQRDRRYAVTSDNILEG
jgi:hypothetical protein